MKCETCGQPLPEPKRYHVVVDVKRPSGKTKPVESIAMTEADANREACGLRAVGYRVAVVRDDNVMTPVSASAEGLPR